MRRAICCDYISHFACPCRVCEATLSRKQTTERDVVFQSLVHHLVFLEP